MSDKMREAAEVAVIDLHEFQRMNPGFLSTGLFLLEEALAALSVPDDVDPCPACFKGGVCRTPKCGRLKLPVGHPYRTATPAQSVPECTWTEHDDVSMPGTYDTGCGQMWSFVDGGVAENKAVFCFGCGGRIVLAAAPEVPRG